MTKKYPIVLALCILFAAGLQAQRRTVVKVNPLSLFITTLNLQGERALNERFSGQVGVFLGSASIRTSEAGADKIRYQSIGITPELRYHATFTTQDCPEGLYFAPYLRLRSIRQSYEGNIIDPDLVANTAEIVYRRNGFGGGVLLGYEMISESGFTLDFFIGPQFIRTFSRSTVTCPDCDGNETFKAAGFDFTGIEVRTGLCIGYAF